MRLTENEFREEYEVTVGVEFGAFLMQIDDKIIKLQIWDTAGQESFKSLNKIFYRGSHCVFLVYDLTREETFNNVEDWLKEVKMNTGNDCMTYLVGNQVDNEDAREVSIDKANQYAKDAGISHVWETSAKTGERVEEIFINAAKMLYIKNKNAMEEKVNTTFQLWPVQKYWLWMLMFYFIGEGTINNPFDQRHRLKQAKWEQRPEEGMRMLIFMIYSFLTQ